MAARRKMIHLLFSIYRNEKRLLFFLAGLCLLAAVTFLVRPFRNDISKMLPDGSESMRCYQTISDSAMFNKAPVLFIAEDDRLFQTDAFARKLNTFVQSLKEEKEVRRVDYKLMERSPAETIRTLIPYLPQYLPAPQWKADQFVKNCLHQFYLPSATGRSAMLEIDPPGSTGQMMMRMEEFRKISNFTVGLNSPYVVSPDQKHLLVMLETASPPADPNGGRALLASVEEKLKTAGFTPGKDVRLLFPHRRAIANERVLKADIQMVTILSIIIFSLLTVFIYRCDPTTFLIPALPFLSAFLTSALMAWCFRTPLFFVVGMGGIVISLALDYGIHIYGAMTDGNSFRSLHHILSPLFAAAATSCVAFLLFLTSKTDAIRQLGFFSGVSLLISLGLMLFLLPPVFRKRKRADKEWFLRWDPVALARNHSKKVISGWIILLILAVVCLPRTRLYFDVRQFDLSPSEYDKDDMMISELFQAGQTPGMALFHGKTQQEALAAAAGAKKIPGCFLPDQIIPLEETRQKNLESWRKIDWAKFRQNVRKAAEKYGFRNDYFESFLQTLQQGIQSPPAGIPEGFRSIADRILVQSKSGEWNAAVLYQDKEEIRMQLAELPGSTIISRHYFPLIMARDIFFGIVSLAIAGVIAVIVLTAAYFRSARDTALALIPVVSALVFTAALFAVTGKQINIPILTGGIILCGLAVDYGIFSVHAMKSGKETMSIFRSVTLSALTTAAGGLTVAFTHHPMLRDAGLTLIAGIFFAWFTALFLLPSIIKHAKKALLLCLCAVILAAIAGCRMTVPFEHERLPVLTESIGKNAVLPVPVRTAKFQCNGSMIMDFKVFRMNTLFMAEWDGKTLLAAGFSPAGAKLFEIKGNESGLQTYYFIPMEKAPREPERIAADLLADLLRIFPAKYGEKRYFDGSRYIVSTDSVNQRKYYFGGMPLKLILTDGDDWKAEYYKYDGSFPVNIVYDRIGLTGYRLILRIDPVVR